MFCQDFIYVKFDFPLCQPSVFPLPCKNGIVSSFWFAFLAVEYLWRAFNHSALNYSTQEVVKLSGTQNTRKNQHSQVLNFNLRLLPVTCQIVKRKTFGQHLIAKLLSNDLVFFEIQIQAQRRNPKKHGRLSWVYRVGASKL